MFDHFVKLALKELMPNIAQMQGLVGNWYLTQSVDTVIMYVTVTLPFEHTADQKS